MKTFSQFFRNPSVSPHRLWIEQRSSLVNPTIATKLQFIRIKPELLNIGRRRTTPFNESDTRVNKKIAITMHPTREETQMATGVSVFWPTVYVCLVVWWTSRHVVCLHASCTSFLPMTFFDIYYQTQTRSHYRWLSMLRLSQPFWANQRRRGLQMLTNELLFFLTDSYKHFCLDSGATAQCELF